MSHTSKYKMKIKDINLLCQTAEDLSYQVIRGDQIVNLWGQNNVPAIASIKIDGWKFPIAITSKGNILYDHFGSEPNTIERLGGMLQKYSLDLITNNMPPEVNHYYMHHIDKVTGSLVLTLNY